MSCKLVKTLEPFNLNTKFALFLQVLKLFLFSTRGKRVRWNATKQYFIKKKFVHVCTLKALLAFTNKFGNSNDFKNIDQLDGKLFSIYNHLLLLYRCLIQQIIESNFTYFITNIKT